MKTKGSNPEPVQSAAFAHLAAGTGPTFSLVGDVYTILMDGDATLGAYALIAARVPPGSGPPPHLHEHDTESFFVLDGRVTFTVANKVVDAESGTFLSVPPGVVHTFRNAGSTTARMLVIISPSGLEKFFQTVGHRLGSPNDPPIPPTEADFARLVSMAPNFGIRITRPHDEPPIEVGAA